MGDPTCANAECDKATVRRSRYCSPYCRHRVKYLTRKREDPEWYEEQKRKQREKYKPVTEDRRRLKTRGVCTEDACDRPHQARGKCKMHYKRWARANGMESPPSDRWTDKRRDAYHARRAQRNGAPNSTPALVTKIIERDGNTCGWCTQPIDMAAQWPDPMSKSVDHVLALSRGGSHTLGNTRLLHFRCNASRGNSESLTEG